MDHKFETLLKSNRNWLSKYGGMISAIIIILLIYGVFQIQIPQYERVEAGTKNEFTIPSNTITSFKKGDVIFVENIKGIETKLTILKVKKEAKKNHIQYTSDTQLSTDESYKLIVAQNSLLKSLTNSLHR